ncbi:NhaP-type Na+/H+ or K+/H+ antiporter [Bradyrhizobium sp. LB9.1b]
MLSIMDIAAVLLTLSAVFGWLNHKFLPLSHSVGLLVMSVVTSLILIGLDALFPGLRLLDQLSSGLQQISFTEIVVNGMLAFLLFAGSLHVDLETLRSRAFPSSCSRSSAQSFPRASSAFFSGASPAWRASPFRSRGRWYSAR